MQLEGALHKLDAVHESFRLWITAEPHPAFPIGLLQMGIKLTNEAPVGMKAGLRASYQWITQVEYCFHNASLLRSPAFEEIVRCTMLYNWQYHLIADVHHAQEAAS